jgi:hypothetical protein
MRRQRLCRTIVRARSRAERRTSGLEAAVAERLVGHILRDECCVDLVALRVASDG